MNEPLISVIVLTYNSKDFVEETLESIFSQSYQAIELIVADDCSQDGTVTLVNNWLETKKERFVHTKIIVPEQNTGTSANCNRGLHAASGVWVKYIAGDDILDSNFFSEMLELLINPDFNVIAGRIFEFRTDSSESTPLWPSFEFPTDYLIQRRLQLVKGLLLAPSVVIRRSTLEEQNGFDTNYRVLEDDPMWIKLSFAGHLFYYSPNSVVYYRQHVASINSMEARATFYRKPVFLNDLINFGRRIRFPHLRKEKLWIHAIIFYLCLSLEKMIYKNGSRLDNFPNLWLKKIIGFLSSIYFSLPIKPLFTK